MGGNIEIIPSAASPRRRVLATLSNLWLGVRGGRYTWTHRGPVNWSTWPWGRHPFGVSIDFRATPLRREAGPGLRGALTMIAITRLPSAFSELDDDLIESMREDAEEVMMRLESAKDLRNDNVVLRVGGAIVEPVYDADYGVQGIEVVAAVEY